MNIRINAVCGCGFRYGTDGIEGVPESEVERLIGLIQKQDVTGIPLVLEAARAHSEDMRHTLEIHGEFRQESAPL